MRHIQSTYTVISTNERTGKIHSFFVTAKDKTHAFFVAAQNHPNMEFVVCIEGKRTESDLLGFPGDSLVDSETILEQEDVFNHKEANHE